MVSWLLDIESMDFMKARIYHVTRLMCRDDPANRHFSMTASMVPFAGGQYLSVMLAFSREDGHVQKIDCAWFQCCDKDNGDDVELPPNGIISPTALPIALKGIHHVLDLTKYQGLSLAAITAGQGLTEHCGRIEEVAQTLYKAGSFFVMPSMSTHAAELAAGMVYPPFAVIPS